MTGSSSFDLRCTYSSAEQPDAHAKRREEALGVICFAPDGSRSGHAIPGIPFAHVPMPALDPAGGQSVVHETWHDGGVLDQGNRAGIHYAHNDAILFGIIQLSEAEFDGNGAQTGKTPLQAAAESAYRAIFAATDALHFPIILRFWNYIADINGNSHGIERYRQFNIGRQDGFLASGHAITGSVPAASAVGFATGPLTVSFLAGRSVTPVAVENPRQVSAYRYPTDYGPRSPTFSRASIVRMDDRDIMFLSGTASIVGHRSLHEGDVVAQTRETLANIRAVVSEANRAAPHAGFTPGDLCYKVYVRHREHVGAIHEELRRELGASARFVFLQADICREDLLVEIEAIANHPRMR